METSNRSGSVGRAGQVEWEATLLQPARRTACSIEASAILTKWFSFTRLETRTKESNMCASVRVVNSDAK